MMDSKISNVPKQIVSGISRELKYYISPRVRKSKIYGIRELDPFEREVIEHSTKRITQRVARLSPKEKRLVSKLEKYVMAVNPNLDRFPAETRKAARQYLDILIKQGYIKASIGDTVVPGHPVFRTNEKFLEFIEKAFERGQTGYSGSTGTPNFKKAIADYTNFRFGFRTDASSVMVGRGATDPIEKVAQALMQGSYGIAGAPFYPPYESATHLAGGKLETIITKRENNFKLRAADIEKRINELMKRGVKKEKIKVLWLTHPSNPTGFFYNERELRDIGKVAAKYNLTVVADEVYGGTVTKGKYKSLLKIWEKLPTDKKFPIVHLGGFSKDPLFWFTGGRIGWAVIPGSDARSLELKRTIDEVLSPPQLNPPTTFEEAGAELINYYLAHPAEFRRHTNSALKVVAKKNELMNKVLNNVPHVKLAGGYPVPDASFYHWFPVDITNTFLAKMKVPDKEFAKIFQQNYRMRITHGSSFYYPAVESSGGKKIINLRGVSLLPDTLIHEIGRRMALGMKRLEIRTRSLKKSA